MKILRRALSLVLILTSLFALNLIPAQAKTTESAKAENIFFYARNADGKDVLLKILTLDELKAISHGQANGGNYYVSATDNYPTTQYAEGQGFTIPELIDYVKKVSTVSRASSITYTGEDAMRFMATDSYGNYNRSWTYNELYGVKRYYFEGLFDSSLGWKNGWEIAGEDNSKFGISLEDYYANYKASDSYYDNKRAVFETGAESAVILATSSYSGRTTTDSLVNSTEPGISTYIAANGGVAAGSLAAAMTDEHSLRLLIPITEADLMSAHRTAYDNFKWIYNMCLDMANTLNIKSQGTVAEPQASVSQPGNTLTITLSCATQGAQIYYSFDGAPQTLYTSPIAIDITGRDLNSDPVTFYMTAVREGWDDAGIITAKYPGMAPDFEAIYSSMTGANLVFKAAEGVAASDWTAWTGALGFVTMKSPSDTGYLAVDASNYKIDNTAKTITFDRSLFADTGSYSFIFHATKYANKSVSVSLKTAAPEITAAESYALGADVMLTFDNDLYGQSLNVYITPTGGSRTMISTTYLDRSVAGQVTIKGEYFTLDSSPATMPGNYVLTLSNSQYNPDSQDVTIALTSGFTDVLPGAWYYDAVQYVALAGLFNGTGGATFSPDTGMTRAMFVTVLGRMADADTSGYTQTGFVDSDLGTWYGPYVAWAADNGIVTGVGEGRFDPDGLLTREQIATMLCRYIQFTGGDVSARADLSAFTDAAQVSGWATDALSWANAIKLINGMGDGTVNPAGTASRAQVAQIMKNYSEIGG